MVTKRNLLLVLAGLMFLLIGFQSLAQEELSPTVEFTLTSRLGGEPAMAFIGVGGDIDGLVNPELRVNVGDVVRITLTNADPIMHDLTIDAFGTTGMIALQNESAEFTFVAATAGTYVYYCAQPGHLQAGMAGNLVVVDANASAESTDEAVTGVSISRNPADLPAPVGNREPMTVAVNLNTMEVVGQLADGTTFSYWTFDGLVPGPMIRVRVGDTVELTLHNMPDSMNAHSIDLHAVTGPGGGAVFTQTAPDGTTSFSFQALNPGLYVYHCATPSVATHIANGMYGLILVEPEGGLPPVDREFYIMQGEIYTAEAFGSHGHQEYDYQAMLDENPEYFVFNGASGALTQDALALRANVGETVRIFFGVGGPNFTSSFHVIGEIFDRVYDQASLTGEPLTDVQTTLVPTGGAVMVEFALEIPGRYILVDHSLARLERGLAGFLYVEGEENPAIFHSEGEASMEGH
jgi:nitrite reductase (NO-forming)